MQSFVLSLGTYSLCLCVQAFEVEVANHRPRMDVVMSDGEALLSTSHFASADIQSQLKALRDGWEQLQQSTANRIEMLEHSMESQKVCV